MILPRTPATDSRSCRTVAGFQPATAEFRPVLAAPYLRSSSEPAPLDMVWHEHPLPSVFHHYWNLRVQQHVVTNEKEPRSPAVHHRLTQHLTTWERSHTSSVVNGSEKMRRVVHVLERPLVAMRQPPAMARQQAMHGKPAELHRLVEWHTFTRREQADSPKGYAFAPLTLRTQQSHYAAEHQSYWQSTLHTLSTTQDHHHHAGLIYTSQTKQFLKHLAHTSPVDAMRTTPGVGLGGSTSTLMTRSLHWQPVALPKSVDGAVGKTDTNSSVMTTLAPTASQAAHIAHQVMARFSRTSDQLTSLTTPSVPMLVRSPAPASSSSTGEARYAPEPVTSHHLTTSAPPSSCLPASTMQQLIDQIVRTMDQRRWADRERMGGF